jgi:hypothetical protein
VSGAHTPGPWEAERVYITIQDPTMRITANNGELYVAEAAYSPTQRTDSIHVKDPDEMRANARLIAAAPELLEALQGCCELLAHIEPEVRGGYSPDGAYARARAAIAKATWSAD